MRASTRKSIEGGASRKVNWRTDSNGRAGSCGCGPSGALEC
jgi:hypothetical protein